MTHNDDNNSNNGVKLQLSHTNQIENVYSHNKSPPGPSWRLKPNKVLMKVCQQHILTVVVLVGFKFNYIIIITMSPGQTNIYMTAGRR